MPYSAKIIKHLDGLEPKVKRVILELLEEIDKNVKESVRKEDFHELKKTVSELSETTKRLADTQEKSEKLLQELIDTQKKTDMRLDSLTLRMEELARAQKKTEERLDSLTLRMEELAQAQKKTEERLDSLTLRMEELAQAQKKTEERLDSLTLRVEELTIAQKKTEERLDSLTKRMEELAIAQKQTDEIVQQLVIDMDGVKKQLGGLSHAVGYGIEDKLFPFMDSFIHKEFGFVPDEVERKFIQYDKNRKDEVNIFIKGINNNRPVIVVGECKSQPGKRDIDDFDEMIKRLKNHFRIDIYGFIVGYIFDPDVEEYIKAHYPYIKYYKTYQVERIALGNR
jgi:uncharacterized phage infection (PIP) family protein YhgE